MNTVRRIAKNTIVLFIAKVVSMGLGFYVQVGVRIDTGRGRGVNMRYILTQY